MTDDNEIKEEINKFDERKTKKEKVSFSKSTDWNIEEFFSWSRSAKKLGSAYLEKAFRVWFKNQNRTKAYRQSEEKWMADYKNFANAEVK